MGHSLAGFDASQSLNSKDLEAFIRSSKPIKVINVQTMADNKETTTVETPEVVEETPKETKEVEEPKEDTKNGAEEVATNGKATNGDAVTEENGKAENGHAKNGDHSN